jgi:hypothetical protein
MQAHIAKPVQLADLGKVIRRWTRAETAPEAAPAPRLAISPDLRARYDARKAELLAYAERLAATESFDDESIAELRGLLHKLAGSAGMFKEAKLGSRAADLEDALELCPPEDRPVRVREVTEALTAA